MRNFLALYSKEMRSYFVSPIAYVVAGLFLLISGFLFRNILMQFNLLSLQMGQRAQYMGGVMPTLNLNEMVVTQFFGGLGPVTNPDRVCSDVAGWKPRTDLHCCSPDGHFTIGKP